MSAPAELRRELTLLDSTMINVGTLIASAIFIVPASIALELQASALILLVWVVGGIVSLLGALSMAELGAAMPQAGGPYVYLREAYSPVWGFLFGWAAFGVINTASISAIAVAFASYLGYFVPLDPTGIKGVAILSIVVLTAIHCFGVRLGADTQNGLTLAKLAAVAALIILCFALPGGSLANFAPIGPRGPVASLVGPFGIAMVAALWAYDGWYEITFVGSEVKNFERNIPRSILLSTVIVIAIYLLINVAYLYVLSPARMAQASLVASDAATVVLGVPGARLIALAIMISTLGANNGIILTGARVPYAMARQGLFFRWAATVHPRFRTPVASLVAQGALASILALTGTYSQIFTYVIFVEWVFFAMSCGAVVILRRRAPELHRPYRTWGYPYTPVVFILFAAWLVISTVVQDPRDAGISTGIILLGLPAYFYWRRQAAVGAR